MCSQAFIKRIVPFVLTLALGLFVASFFVSISPSFKFRKNRYNQRKEVQQLRYEKERLEMENQRLQQRLEENEKRVLLEAPLPPPPPTSKVREIPMDPFKPHEIPAPPKAK